MTNFHLTKGVRILGEYIVYMHISPSGKKYIGITKQDPKRRWNSGNGYKNNDYFTKAIKKYGWNNFLHIILAENLTEEQAKEMEISLISKHNSTDRNYGYNITFGGDPCNRGYSEEERKKRAYESQKRWIENNKEHFLEMQRKRDRTEKRHAQANARNKRPEVREKRTEYMRKYRTLNRDKFREQSRKYYRKNNPNPYKGKKVLVYDKGGELLFEFSSLRETADNLGYHKNTISNFLRGKKNCIKYDFKYKEDAKID